LSPSVHEINAWRLIFGEAAISMHLFFLIKKPTKQQHGFLSNAPPKKGIQMFMQHPILSSIRYDTGIDAWMVRPALSGCVRCYFPGILEDTVHPFLHCKGCVDPRIELAKHCYPFENLTVFPFDACRGLYNNPPANKTDTNKKSTNWRMLCFLLLPRAGNKNQFFKRHCIWANVKIGSSAYTLILVKRLKTLVKNHNSTKTW
jgi:hypothetical protein